jgi:hypothetical protein
MMQRWQDIISAQQKADAAMQWGLTDLQGQSLLEQHGDQHARCGWVAYSLPSTSEVDALSVARSAGHVKGARSGCMLRTDQLLRQKNLQQPHAKPAAAGCAVGQQQHSRCG